MAAMIAAAMLQASQAYFSAKAQSYQYKTQQFKYETDWRSFRRKNLFANARL